MKEHLSSWLGIYYAMNSLSLSNYSLYSLSWASKHEYYALGTQQAVF